MIYVCLPVFAVLSKKKTSFFKKKTRVTRELRVREVGEWEPPMNQWFLSGYLWAIENTFTSWRTQTLSFQSAVPYCVQNVQMYEWHLPGVGHASAQPFLTKTEHAVTYLSKGNEPKLQTCNHKSCTQHRKKYRKVAHNKQHFIPSLWPTRPEKYTRHPWITPWKWTACSPKSHPAVNRNIISLMYFGFKM